MNKAKTIHIAQWVFRIILSGVLLLAGVLKLQNSVALFETMAYITWLPVSLRLMMVDFLPYIEIVLALLLLVRWKEIVILPIVALVFAGFLGFAIYGTLTGMEGDCGCFGELMDSSFGAKMIIRNALFAGMAGILFWKPQPAITTESSQDL